MSQHWLLAALLTSVLGCAGQSELQVEGLQARDVLGLDPAVAAGLSDAGRARALELIDRAAMEGEDGPLAVAQVGRKGDVQALSASMRALDRRLWNHDRPVVVVGLASELPGELRVDRAPRPLVGANPRAAEPAALDWSRFSSADESLLGELAESHSAWVSWALDGMRIETVAPLLVLAAEQQPFGILLAHRQAGEPVVLVNPALLALLPSAPSAEDGEHQRAAASGGAPAALTAAPPTERASVASGNPYSFYGSVGECAAAQRDRCEGCLSGDSCEPITVGIASAADECSMLAADGGRGFALLCANLAVAIATVEECSEEGASCRASGAELTIENLESNAEFVDDAACAEELDRCLGEIYGAPDDEFPTPGDIDAGPGGGGSPRQTEVDCGSNSPSCEFSPELDCSGPSCSSSSSCEGSGCESGCDDGDGGGSSGGGGCGPSCDNSCDNSCGGGDDGGGGGSCDGGDSDSSGGGSCDGGDSDSSGGGSCDGGEGSSGGGCDCGSGSGSNSCGDCATVRRRAPIGSTVLVGLLWMLAPFPLLRRQIRRAERQARRQGRRR